jgi:hypothetical protein
MTCCYIVELLRWFETDRHSMPLRFCVMQLCTLLPVWICGMTDILKFWKGAVCL